MFNRDKSLAKKKQMEKDDPSMKIKKRVKVNGNDLLLTNLLFLFIEQTVAFSIQKEKKLKSRLKRLRREQAENERIIGAETERAENEKHIEDIGKEYAKLKKQRRLLRFSVRIY